MPYIDRSTASLRFIGEGLDPNELQKRLEFCPLEQAANPIVKTRKEKFTIWSVGRSKSDSSELENKIAVLLSWFTDDINVWKEVSVKYKGEVFCGLFLEGWNRGLELSTELLRRLSDRNLSISFDIYSSTYTQDEKD